MKKQFLILVWIVITNLSRPGISQTKDIQAFLNGPKTKYSTEGHPKAKGINISIEYPSHWQRSETDRPNIVQEFISETPDGQFLMQCMLMIKDQPSFIKFFSSEDISDVMFNEDVLKEIVPEGATFIKGDRTKYDGEPGAWLIYMIQSERAGLRAESYILQHMFFYSRKLIGLQCGVTGLPGSAARVEQEFISYLPLFQLLGNSIIIQDKWNKTLCVTDILSDVYGEYWIINLIFSAIITWGIGLTPPLLIRFVFVRRPISKRWAIGTVILFWFFNFVIFSANAAAHGGRIGGAIVLIAFASYPILRKGAKKQKENIPLSIVKNRISK